MWKTPQRGQSRGSWLIVDDLSREVNSLSHVRLCDPTGLQPTGSSVHGIFQARIQEWVAISFSDLPSPEIELRSPAL